MVDTEGEEAEGRWKCVVKEARASQGSWNGGQKHHQKKKKWVKSTSPGREGNSPSVQHSASLRDDIFAVQDADGFGSNDNDRDDIRKQRYQES